MDLGSAQSSDQTIILSWPHAGTDHLTVSYLATYINVDFVDLFSATDVRAVFKRRVVQSLI
jgi:hypothetical protein